MTSIPPTRKDTNPESLGATGTEMRDLAVGALTGRHGVLLERSKQRQLTPVERSEVDRLELAINTLQSMGTA